jgi:GNAT superfamily N-acetyltransferase
VRIIPDSWGSARVREANDCHTPAGSDKGGEFCDGDGVPSKPSLKLSSAAKTTPRAFIEEVFEKVGQDHPMLGRNETILGGAVIAELQDRGDSVYLTGLRSVEQGKGHGSAAMKTITELADKRGVTLTLVAKPLDVRAPLKKTSKAKLVAFYKRYGFVPDRNYGGGSMIRKPQS